MAEDYRRNNGDDALVIQLVLRDIADIVRSMGKDIKSFGLPHLDESGTPLPVYIYTKIYNFPVMLSHFFSP